MAGRITALEPQKRSRRRYNIYLDGEFAFGLAEAEAARLTIGDWLSDEEIAALKAADDLERAREKALSYLSYRPRSETELKRYLRDKDFSDQVIEDVIERLRRVELVDDREFARFWVENRTRFRQRGRRALVVELRQKGVARRDIDAVLEDYDEGAALETLAQAQARRLSHLPPEKFRRRLTQRLARRGFPYDLIHDVVARYASPHFNPQESEEE
jgi:regulatory protein